MHDFKKSFSVMRMVWKVQVPKVISDIEITSQDENVTDFNFSIL